MSTANVVVPKVFSQRRREQARRLIRRACCFYGMTLWRDPNLLYLDMSADRAPPEAMIEQMRRYKWDIMAVMDEMRGGRKA